MTKVDVPTTTVRAALISEWKIMSVVAVILNVSAVLAN